MKSKVLIIIGIIITVSSLLTIVYFTNEGLDVERCTGDTVYKDFTGEIVLREICILPFTGKTITDTFLGCDEGFKQIDDTCVLLNLESEPTPEPEPTYTLNEPHCFPNQVIYNDECIYVLNPTDEFPKDMTKYFLMVDNEIINFCIIESTTSQDRENTSGVTLDRCFEISHYVISDVNEIEFQSTTPPTWINIKLEDWTRNVELGSSPAFTIVESGWGNGCTSPTLEVYHLKQEFGHSEIADDDLIYKHQIVYSCPWYESVYPPPEVLRIWDESDFPNFPICEEQGGYLIIGDSGYERLALDYYYCGMENPEPFPAKCKSGPAPNGGNWFYDEETCDWIEREWYEGEWYEGDQFEKIIQYCTDPKSNTIGETSSINKGGEIKLDSKNCTWMHGGFYNQAWVNQTAEPVPLIQNGNVISPEGNIIRPVK